MSFAICLKYLAIYCDTYGKTWWETTLFSPSSFSYTSLHWNKSPTGFLKSKAQRTIINCARQITNVSVFLCSVRFVVSNQGHILDKILSRQGYEFGTLDRWAQLVLLLFCKWEQKQLLSQLPSLFFNRHMITVDSKTLCFLFSTL